MREKYRGAGHDLCRQNPRRGAGARAEAHESERAEQMQRPRDVLQQEPDRDQIGHHPPRAREPVVRRVLRPWNVRDRHFRDSRSAPARECGNESMEIAVETDALDHWSPVRFERRPEVVKRHAGELCHQPVGHLRGQTARPEIVDPLLSPSAHDVVAIVQFREQLGNLLGRMLQVAVHRDDHVARGGVEAGGERGSLAIIPGETDDSHSQIPLGHRRQTLRRAIGAAIVDIDDF